MNKLWKGSEQRGTLLVEAIAMLALIAMVTPTLYRKSAERLQEIQDINIASQMRTLNTAVNSFIKGQSGSLIQYSKEASTGNTFKICYEDSSTGCYSKGYSSMVPFGYNPYDVKNFLPPEVYVYGNDGLIQYYIVYGKETEIGKKRANRLASLVGSNGGVINHGGITGGSSITVNGTGNAWSLSHEDITDKIGFDTDILTADSLMITATEPIVIDQDENDVYLYRVPPTAEAEGEYYKNTMITDLYMGGYGNQAGAAYSGWDEDHFSIFNVRKLTMNTVCTNDKLIHNLSSEDDACVPEDVADLYIGKPKGQYLREPGTQMGAGKTRYYKANKGAAWIYGNLSALNDNFRVFRGGLSGSEDYSTIAERATGYDVMQFARLADQREDMSFSEYDDDSSVALQIFRATNEEGSSRVSMMDGLVNVVENFDNPDIMSAGNAIKALAVGQNSSTTGGEGSLLSAFHMNDENYVFLNSGNTSSHTWINKYGGDVYINKVTGTSSTIYPNTYINNAGGTLMAGSEGEWLYATAERGSARVDLLRADSTMIGGDNRIFTVGDDIVENKANMIYGDSTRVSLRGDSFRVYNQDVDGHMSTGVGGRQFVEGILTPNVGDGTTGLYEGATVVGTQTLDVLGSTYLGSKDMKIGADTTDDGDKYTRGKWVVGVAGSAWVDETLWARRGWLKQGGMAELHAGFSSFEEFDEAPENAWLNVYNDKHQGLIIRNKDAINGSGSTWTGDDVLFMANSSGVEIRGNATGASTGSTFTFAEWRNDKVLIGAAARVAGEVPGNVFAADINAANVQGSSLANIYTVDGSTDGVVNIQDDAMQFRGRVSSSAVYENEILAQAKWFGVTANSSFVEEENVQFRVGSSDAIANASEVRVRNADFAVRDSSGVGKFWVRPDEDVVNSSLANVNIDGSLYVTGNEIVHIASNMNNTSEKDSQHAMFEIDPQYVQVWGKTSGGSSYAGSSATDYYAMLRINPYDTSGGVSDIADTTDASIYVRKGAIELMQSEGVNGGSSTVGASEGFGYIKANRLVSNAGVKISPDVGVPGNVASTYDEYMVNPAYTSVMHDIKLTTRGGGRLSDILPDYVLKGVYNVSNDFREGSKQHRIHWSCGSQCNDGTYTSIGSDVQWANSYVGKIPFGLCPPGYVNLATIMPISFMMGQAGEIMKAGEGITNAWGAHAGDYFVNFGPAQNAVLSAARTSSTEVAYPVYHKVRSVTMESLNKDASWSEPGVPENYFKNITNQIEGWFLGMPYEGKIEEDSTLATYDQYMTGDKTITNVGVWNYKDVDASGNVRGQYTLAQPLYFQQNTWLKTAVDPKDGYWEAYMGFIYDKTLYDLGDGLDSDGLVSNNSGTDSSQVFLGYGGGGNFVWNLFPVPTNSIEGHATVYCYFDRTKFQDYQDTSGRPLVDYIDQMGQTSFREPGGTKLPAGGDARAEEYLRGLDDPTLKYSNPW